MKTSARKMQVPDNKRNRIEEKKNAMLGASSSVGLFSTRNNLVLQASNKQDVQSDREEFKAGKDPESASKNASSCMLMTSDDRFYNFSFAFVRNDTGTQPSEDDPMQSSYSLVLSR